MDYRRKLRMRALKHLADQKLDETSDEYRDKFRDMKLDRGKALLHTSPASKDKENKEFLERVREKERLADLENEGKSDEQIENEAYNKLYKERLKRGLTAKPPRDGSKRRK